MPFAIHLAARAAGLEVCLHGPLGTWSFPAAAADLPAFREALVPAEHALVLLYAERPLAALLCPLADVVLPAERPAGA